MPRKRYRPSAYRPFPVGCVSRPPFLNPSPSPDLLPAPIPPTIATRRTRDTYMHMRILPLFARGPVGSARGQWDLSGRSCKVYALFTSPLRLSDATPSFRMTPQCPPGSLVCRLASVSRVSRASCVRWLCVKLESTSFIHDNVMSAGSVLYSCTTRRASPANGCACALNSLERRPVGPARGAPRLRA